MRHIAIDTFKPSDSWQQRATQAMNELNGKVTPQDKLDYIKARDDIWKALGKELIAHFGNKCWYTDAANYGARLDVEHFRPKAKTVELTEADCPEATSDLLRKAVTRTREGYWWLAFHPDNLMLCAQVMNREEKRNFFPLHKDSQVASSISQNTWRDEIPAFLDPRRLDDVCLVDYDDSGAMRPRDGLEPWELLRVVITNECFGLSRFQPLIEGRQRMWQKCTQLMDQYAQAAKKQKDEGTPNQGLQQMKNDAMGELKKLLQDREPFATVAKSCLRNSPYHWARTLASQP